MNVFGIEATKETKKKDKKQQINGPQQCRLPILTMIGDMIGGGNT